MPYINYNDKELSFKVVYFGPGMSGKTTNLAYVHKNVRAKALSEMVTLDTEEERTLFFDFLPLELGSVYEFSLRFNLYTVPGQIWYEASRRLILDGADGVVFVIDSQPSMFERNVECLTGLIQNLESYGLDPATFPLTIQYNKRDCDSPLPLGCVEKELGLKFEIPVFEAVATQGVGVMETISDVCKRIVSSFTA